MLQRDEMEEIPEQMILPHDDYWRFRQLQRDFVQAAQRLLDNWHPAGDTLRYPSYLPEFPIVVGDLIRWGSEPGAPPE